MSSHRKKSSATLPTKNPVAELPVGECAALIGLDWGDKRHAIALLAHGAQHRETLELEHSAESLHAWLDALKVRFAGQCVAIAVEASKGAIINALLEHPWLLIYPVHPATSRRFSMAFTPSGAKADVPDAQTLLELVRHHRGRLRALLPHDPATRQLALLNELRRKVVDHRTLLSNQLTSVLKGYYPQALELMGEKRFSPLALDFVERWPDLALLQAARPETLRRFYHVHQVRRPELIEERLKLVRAARPLTKDANLCEISKFQVQMLIDQIRVLNEHVAQIDQKVVAAFAAHPEADLFKSLPGAGAAMAPRLTVLFGTDRTRWVSPTQLQNYYGIAPVTQKSGGQKWVHWRWNAPCFARQTLVEWAGLSAQYSSWAKAYYLEQKRRGKSHSVILRSLAFKWLRILWRCWQDHQPYDEARYVARLQLRNPALFTLIQAA
jgi:transposase